MPNCEKCKHAKRYHDEHGCMCPNFINGEVKDCKCAETFDLSDVPLAKGARVRLVKPVDGFTEYGSLPLGSTGTVLWAAERYSIHEGARKVQWDDEHWQRCGAFMTDVSELEAV